MSHVSSLVDRIWLGIESNVSTMRQRAALLDLTRRVHRLGTAVRIGVDGRIIGGDQMTIGDGVRMGNRTWLQTVEVYAGVQFRPEIVIGDNVTMEDGCHIGAIGRIEIGTGTLIASDVLITDHKHGHEDVDLPVRDTPLRGGGLSIGEGSHIGQHACLLGPLTVGRHCVVGANAVVTHDVPDFTVVVGAPARAIARYDKGAGLWLAIR